MGDLSSTKKFVFQIAKLAIIAVGLGIYLIALRSSGTHNMDYYILWTKEFIHGNLFDLYHVSKGTEQISSVDLTVPYTPFSLYVIGLTAKILLFFAKESSTLYIIAVNLTCSLFSLATFFLLRSISLWRKTIDPLFYLFSPTVILATPILGYQDSIMTYFIILTVILAEKKKFLFCGITSSLAIMSKQLALMPILAIAIILLIKINYRQMLYFLFGFFLTTFIVLSPFVINGFIISYFKSQILTSVHTMLSAGAANFPWVLSLCVRMLKNGFWIGINKGGNLLVIEPDIFRQFTYLIFGVLVLLIFLIWLKQEMKSTNDLDYFKGASVMLVSYYLFSAGVHENHIFSILALTFALTSYKKGRIIFLLLNIALFLSLFSNYCMGRSFFYSTSIINYLQKYTTSITIISLVLYVLALTFINKLKKVKRM